VLSGHAVAADHPGLAALLAAATAPGLPGELAGEQACVAAFRAAAHAPSRRPRPVTTIRKALLKVLTVKAAIAALATTAAGGLALAAGTGTLPDALHGEALGPAPAHTSPAHSVPAAPRGNRSPGAVGSPTAQADEAALVALCRAYGAGNKAERGKALDNPAFSVLVSTAGGRDRVDAYCAELLSPALEHPTPAAKPDKDQRPSERPAHPTGKPSTRPGR